MMKIYTFLILFILLIGNAEAWNSYYHRSLAERTYYSLDFKTQENLNLTLILKGSTDPDLVFHDVVKHHYPPSYELAVKWLEKAKISYQNKDYNNASYSFGVASHYIGDSFVSPHYISKEPGSLHSEFENIDKKYKFKSKCHSSTYDLNQTLYQGSLNRQEWTLWLLSRDKEIPKKELEQALIALYPIAQETFNSSCNNFETEIVKRKFNLLNFFR